MGYAWLSIAATSAVCPLASQNSSTKTPPLVATAPPTGVTEVICLPKPTNLSLVPLASDKI